MKIAQIFAQGGGHGHGYDCGCGCGSNDWGGDGPYRPTGYHYRRYDHGYYSYNDGCGYNPHPRYGNFLGLH